ncbi:unnamed protein product [Moneuplotes crassus]|uniref:C2H2-type domain-containing protein n=1 Tax=Euplotes crassus TaxID=5936 RepID=A0AAD1Y4Q6_EUPCR|nr:unnamed protein product [Moneuplotes crassus]
MVLNQLSMLVKHRDALTSLALAAVNWLDYYCLNGCSKQSFISVRDKKEFSPSNSNSLNNPTSVQKLNGFVEARKSTENHQTQNQVAKGRNEASSQDTREVIHYETYKQLKEVSLRHEPGVSKTELYENLLKPFKHEKRIETLPDSGRTLMVYICKHGNCNREFTKIWNLVDHSRMHKGIRPYKCNFCSKAFTQKGNLKKHSKQHQHKSLEERRKFQCRICKKRYTEKYNLMAHMRTHKQKDTP